jgi:methionyl-tRNA synthetase
MLGMAFHKALVDTWEFINAVNRYIDQSAPWTLAKEKFDERLKTVMRAIFESIQVISTLIYPFMPGSAQKIRSSLGCSESRNITELLKHDSCDYLETGVKVEKLPPLFPRIETADRNQVEDKPVFKPEISYTDFQKLDLRVARILKAESVPGSEKLLKLSIDVGETRTVVSGIAGFYKPDDLIGKHVIVLANLKPAKLMGIRSEGMILAVESEGSIILPALSKEVHPGDPVL